MKLRVTYICDVCEQPILINFQQAMQEKKISCNNCGVDYEFTDEELSNFSSCYNDFLTRMKNKSSKTAAESE